VQGLELTSASSKAMRVWSDGRVEEITERYPLEKAYKLTASGRLVALVSLLPTLLREFACGFLVTEGLSTPGSIRSVSLDGLELKVEVEDPAALDSKLSFYRAVSRLIRAPCSSLSPETLLLPLEAKVREVKLSFKVTPSDVWSAISWLRKSKLYRELGMVHVCAIAKPGAEAPMVIAEDVGRHSAVDKAVGYLVLNRIADRELMLCVSGRLTGDLVAKAARAGIPIVASISGPTSTGVEIARKAGVTLIGFARGARRLTVYTGEERIAI